MLNYSFTQYNVFRKLTSLRNISSIGPVVYLLTFYITSYALFLFLVILVYSHKFTFLRNRITSTIDFSSLLSLFNYKILLINIHQRTLFYIPLYTTNYMSNKPINRLILLANEDSTFLFKFNFNY